MKQILALAFAAFLVIACEKNDPVDETGAPISTSIIGKWELRTVRGNIANCCNYPPGNGNMLKFGDNQYEIYENNLLTKIGSYLVINDTTAAVTTCLTIFTASTPNRIIYDSNFSSLKTFFNIKNGQLMLTSGCVAADAGSKTYDRVK